MSRYAKIVVGLAAAGAIGVFPATSAGHGGIPSHGGPGAHHSMKQAVVNAQGARSTTVNIPHVQDGCHLWAAGAKQSYNMKLLLKRGARLTIVNRDINGHHLVQQAGPKVPAARLSMNAKTTIAFAKAGVYRFVTKAFEIPGMPEVGMEGTDHPLQLTVVVT